MKRFWPSLPLPPWSLLGSPLVGLLLGLFLAAGCAPLLPVAKTHTETQWQSFEEVKETFDRIVPYQTTREELLAMQIDPAQTPNLRTLTYPEIINLFLSNTSLNLEHMDPGLRHCIENGAKCTAYQLNLKNVDARRHGSVLLDLFRFKRETHQTGWHFSSLVVIVDETVVYKIWGGTRRIDEHLYQRNPLGLLQDPAETMVKDAIPVVGGML